MVSKISLKIVTIDMEKNINKNKIWIYVLTVYFICFCFRFLEYFLIRTDSTFFGEAFIHKLLGIIVLFVTAGFLYITPGEMGFLRSKFSKNLLRGFLLGLLCYFLAYTVEIIIVQNLGEFDKLSLFVTSYSVNGNLGNHTEAIFFIICILGNIINVVMEEGVFRGLFQNLFERRYSFWPSAIFASLLFGLWHCVGPIRSFTDGDSNRMQLIMNLLILIGSSTLIGLKYAMLAKITGSLYAGMADHFVNNTIINILHVVSISEMDQLQTIRISIAQTVSFIIVFIVYYSKTINGCKK
ncbi:type II CAAX endopeptidase family protein [Treponema bryantii]|uniref:CPBP family intramembrane glutamic endopeptidase n=1 Tax=Treponema bryantii TaxID=163 RepID=UPI0030C7D6F5